MTEKNRGHHEGEKVIAVKSSAKPNQKKGEENTVNEIKGKNRMPRIIRIGRGMTPR